MLNDVILPNESSIKRSNSFILMISEKAIISV
jgi:hypothetical protein